MMNFLLEKVKQGIAYNKDIDYYLDIYSELFKYVRWLSITIDHSNFYRARILDKSQLFLNINELKYPPSAVVKERGRLNDVGESVAYLSAGLISPLAELEIDYYQLFCMVEIEYHLKDILFFCIGAKADYYGLTSDEVEFISFFNSLLTSADKHVYPATIAFAHMVFKKEVAGGTGKTKTGIVYNSAQEHKTNQILHNIAVTPQAFDECFRIKKAMYQIMSYSQVDNFINVQNINEGQVLDNGDIKWNYSFSEMMSLCDNKFNDDISVKINEKGEHFLIKYPEGSGKIIKADSSHYFVNFKRYGETIIRKTLVSNK